MIIIAITRRTILVKIVKDRITNEVELGYTFRVATRIHDV